MSWSSLLGALLFGGVFAVFHWFDIEPPGDRAGAVLAALFLFGTYCGLVLAGTAHSQRTLSMSAQTGLGVACALAIAAVVGAGASGYGIAALLGLILGYTADVWVRIVEHF